MAIRTIWLMGAGFCLGAVCVACGRSSAVRLEDVRITPATAADVQRAVRETGAKAVLVNMWATWCGPCREEFPDLVKLSKNYRDRGLRVVFVSWDDDEAMARQFLAEQGVDLPSYIKVSSESDPDFINAIEPRWTGAFPATMVYDASGVVRSFWEGKASYAQLEQRVLEVLNQQTHGG